MEKNGVVLLSLSYGWMDNFEFFDSGMIGSGGLGGLIHGFLQILEFYGR
jgi:hypothetical protein